MRECCRDRISSPSAEADGAPMPPWCSSRQISRICLTCESGKLSVNRGNSDNGSTDQGVSGKDEPGLRKPERHVVLVAPEVHWNTGNIGRTCLGASASLHLIKPLGFSLDSRRTSSGQGLTTGTTCGFVSGNRSGSFRLKWCLRQRKWRCFPKTQPARSGSFLPFRVCF